jgi:hypothetical protein
MRRREEVLERAGRVPAAIPGDADAECEEVEQDRELERREATATDEWSVVVAARPSCSARSTIHDVITTELDSGAAWGGR